MLKNESFWCNRSDSCDNDSIPIDAACQSKKTAYLYCESTNECLTSEGLACLNKQCTCSDPDNYYFSASDSTCLPRKAISQACTSNIECLSRELLTCQNSICQCPNTTTYYYSEFNNTCQEKNTYQESCNVTNDGCRSDLGLDCNSELNVCDCINNNIR